ncbi:MAG: DUF4301 family protein [Bacteroidales bacterium]|nr:DUF4301 family protein [Bacteroidales bacterium]
MLNEQDIKQLEKKNISRDAFLEQIHCFKSGFPPLNIDRPATPGDGILVFDKGETEQLLQFFNDSCDDYVMQKFVPASGAATRMFKDVFVWRDLIKAGVGITELLDSHKDAAAFFGRMRDMAFWEDLKLVLDQEDLEADSLLHNNNYLPLLDFLFFDQGLDYAGLPKALIAFHKYDYHSRTSMEEQLAEGAFFVKDRHGVVRIHFTLSPEHITRFEERLKAVRKKYENNYGVRYEISWSIQKPSTDTIAVGDDNLPFREKDGSLLFRPGGHGALIDNLQDLDEADVIFIKNIDNVVPDRLKPDTITYKKALGALLIQLQQNVTHWLKKIDEGSLSESDYRDACSFAVNKLNIDKNSLPECNREGSANLHRLLNRPLRVCGMVKNEGEPGGGPFWIKDKDGSLSLQIVEASQIDMKDKKQAARAKKATHFNPVDLVCSIKDYKGEPFDLKKFIDPSTGFISHKSKDGKALKALERPGLWNGAMAFWNTVFVEVPLITFNPVKTINDLLRPEHQ